MDRKGADSRGSCGSGCRGCRDEPVQFDRREFLAAAGLTLMAGGGTEAVAGPFRVEDFSDLVPPEKKFAPGWIESLTARGEPEHYRGGELKWIGMPVGGLACGQLYLGGDGRLWLWDVFTSATTTDYGARIWAGLHYETPMTPSEVVKSGFALRVGSGSEAVTRALDQTGFRDIDFRGEYPIGRVVFEDDELPVRVELEAFSPFVPLSFDDSSLPATVMSYRVIHRGGERVSVGIDGWVGNPVCPGGDAGFGLERLNRVTRGSKGSLVLACEAVRVANPVEARPDIVFAEFEGDDYGDWTVDGEAFGTRPYREGERRFYTSLVGFEGSGFVNSHRMSEGQDSVKADLPTGVLTSPEFTITRNFIQFRIGGGGDVERLGLRLLVEGEETHRAAGRDAGPMRREAFDVRGHQGKRARIRIVDEASGGWGHTTVDQIVFSDRPRVGGAREVPGYGSMALTLLGGGERHGADLGMGPGIEAESVARALDGDGRAEARGGFESPLVGGIGRTVILEPGSEATFTFVITWWFPYYGVVQGEMASIEGMPGLRRHYARRFEDAVAVARHVVDDFERLSGTTRLWNRTWYDSTLPYWLLDRSLVTVDCLATQTFHAFDDGRFWGWEGVNCCPGTCQHVWQYAQASGRLFPEVERGFRERVDFGLAWHENGAMDYRAENARTVAHDGFCGTVSRVYREHQMSADGAFLERLWPRIRRSLEHVMAQDRDADGLLEGEQMNTLDAAWFGPMGWISSLYLAALAAGQAMAAEVGDRVFERRCAERLESGRERIVAQLFNGEYFIHRPDPAHPEATNTNDGCHIDQVFGQSWAWQVGLPRVIPLEETRSALRSLWKYNVTPDVGPWREGMKTVLAAGRWYAMPGEGGMIMCTWPRGGAERAAGKGNPTFVGYFTECMTGFEYQVASHMVWEGLVTEGLAATRLIHDRYHASRRNPYNEVECSDHYSRAMASYGVFVAACGFEYHGPKGHLGFAPRIGAEDFRAPFVTAEGWGTYSQKRMGEVLEVSLELKYGRLRLRSLRLEPVEGAGAEGVEARVGGVVVPAVLEVEGRRARVGFDPELVVEAGEVLSVALR